MIKKLKINLSIIICLAILSLAYVPIVHSAGATASGKTVADLTSEVRSLLNESTADFWTDAEIVIWINSAIKNVIARTHCLSSVTQFTLDSGTSEYKIVEDYVFVKGVIYQSGVTTFRALSKGSEAAVGLTTKEMPQYFYETKAKPGVGIYPLIDSKDTTVSGNTIYVSFVPLQATLTGTSSIPTPATFDKHIVYYAAGHGFIKDNKLLRAKLMLEQYQSELDRFRIDLYDWEKSIWDYLLPKQRPADGKE